MAVPEMKWIISCVCMFLMRMCSKLTTYVKSYEFLTLKIEKGENLAVTGQIVNIEHKWH